MQRYLLESLWRRLLPASLAIVVAGCASSPDEDEFGLAQPPTYDDVRLIEGEPGLPFTERGAVRGFICYRSTFDFELKSKDAALRDMRRQAVELGADAIIRLECQAKNKRDWLKNCLATMTCTGDAVRLQEKR